MAQALTMGGTVEELADRICVDPGDIMVMVATYPPDVADVWEEAGVLGNAISDDLDDTLNPMCARTVPELYPPL